MSNTFSTNLFYSKNNDKSKDRIIVQSMIHTAQMPETSLWPKLFEALNFWFKVPKEHLQKIGDIIRVAQVINNVLNDVSENALLRKGAPTANSLHGNADAINSAFYSCFIVLEKLRDLEKIEAMKIGAEYFVDTSRGQGLEIYWRDNVVCPTEDEYLIMATYRTGSILVFTVKLMQLFSENNENFDKMIEILTKFFHIYDDYTSLKSMEEYLLNKNGLDILKEGKFTFPIIHAILNKPDNVQIINILRQKSADPEVIKYCLKLTEKYEGFEYTRKTLKKLKEEAKEEMKKFQENALIDEILEIACSKLS